MKNTITISELSESVKQSVNQILVKGEAEIVFYKVDGTIRRMKATISPELTPKIVTENTEQSKRQSNENVRTVYDLEAKAWKSFRWDKLVSITGEQI